MNREKKRNPTPHSASASASPFAGESELAALCRDFDWSGTRLGAVASWPASLRTATAIVLGSRYPMILVWGPERIQIYNDAYSALIPDRHPAALGMATHECWPELRPVQEPLFERVFRGETVELQEAPYVLEQGGTSRHVWFDATFVPVPAGDGTIGGSMSTLFDVTNRVMARGLEAERERLRATLELERARLQQLFRAAPAYIAVVRGPDHVFELTNQHYQRLIGGRHVVGMPVREALPELVDQDHIEALDTVHRTGTPHVASEQKVLYRNVPDAPEEEYYISFVYQPLVDADGVVDGILAHGVDVSEQVRARSEVERLLSGSETARQALAAANEALRTSEERLLATFRHASIGLVLADLDGRILNANHAFCRMIGQAGAEVARTSLLEHVHPDDREAIAADLGAVRSGADASHTGEHRMMTGPGSACWTRSSIALLRDVAGQPTGMVAVVEDVDERVRLGRRRDLLSRADRVLASGGLEVEGLLRAVSVVAVPDVADFCFFDVLRSDGALQRAAGGHATRRPPPRSGVRRAFRRDPADGAGAIRGGSPRSQSDPDQSGRIRTVRHGRMDAARGDERTAPRVHALALHAFRRDGTARCRRSAHWRADVWRGRFFRAALRR